MHKLIVACLLLLSAGSAFAQEWVATRIDAPLDAPKLVRPTDRSLPTFVARAADGDKVESVWFDQPTDLYPHGVFGTGAENGRLVVKLRDGEVLFARPLFNNVFEERLPRLADLDIDGVSEVITAMSHVELGASIAVFGLREGRLELLAQTPYIGIPYRWRNIAGIADFDGDGSLQIAEVVTPHIGGTLRFWTWRDGALVPSGAAYGFSNHAYGSPEQRLSAIEDFNNDGVEDLALPGADRKSLKLMAFSGKANGEKTLNQIASIDLPAEISEPIVAKLEDGKVTLRVGLIDGSVWSIHQ